MTKEEWQLVLAPKLTGTWDHQNKLLQEMDLFALSSSLSGMIFVMGQSQYNACISIDLGLVTSVEGFVVLHEEELYSVVD
ncbi:hypothetical protein BDV38DRAFT_285041 [Aspergillus pseudotamarii]|uniref:Ketoreductase (KR) domain-containing protein n=1 Tax=Aspergillus pseudotamarii TaxID=132259 RepID=A0A5N6SKI4_ASPPS|nr:uncharacterized protein BDV38DRAFT_285041 [Aspergillus pseudotamarii]KAE8135208.1 hypothetical protein BDV38DRAFT_285041 [Aspergillus pseudotamarii]